LDKITLAALGVASGDSATVEGIGSSFVLTDAVNELVQTIDADTHRSVILAATNAGLFKTFDPMKGWTKVPFGAGFDVHTTSISTLLKSPNRIWVGTASSGVLVTSDGGVTWQQVENLPSEAPINVIAQDPQRPSHIYVGTKQTFYASQDGGQHWQRRGGNLPFGDFTSIVINPQNTDEVFAGNAFQNGEFGGGVYHSTNAGLTWTRIDPKEHRLASMRIWALALDPKNQSLLFVGSHSAGIYVVPRTPDGTASAQR